MELDSRGDIGIRAMFQQRSNDRLLVGLTMGGGDLKCAAFLPTMPLGPEEAIPLSSGPLAGWRASLVPVVPDHRPTE